LSSSCAKDAPRLAAGRFTEVGLPGIGNFDFVIVKHKPLSNIVDDFAVIEFQTGQTTSTGKLVDGFKKFMKDGFLKSDVTYNFGVNSYDIWKRTGSVKYFV